MVCLSTVKEHGVSGFNWNSEGSDECGLPGIVEYSAVAVCYVDKARIVAVRAGRSAALGGVALGDGVVMA